MRRLITATACALILAGCAAKTEATPRGLVGSTPPLATMTAAPETSEAEPADLPAITLEASTLSAETSQAAAPESSADPTTSASVPTASTPAPIVITPASHLSAGEGSGFVAAGDASAVGSWELIVGETNADALAAVVEAGAKPITEQDDVSMVLTPVKGLYYGGTGKPASWDEDLVWSWVGPQGDVFPLLDSPCSAEPVAPPEKVGENERNSGAVCIAVPDDQVVGGMWQVVDVKNEWTSFYQGVPK